MTKVRTQIYLTEEQHQMLNKVSIEGKIPMAQIVRQAIDEYLSKTR
jgi:predicted DNA-binding protein